MAVIRRRAVTIAAKIETSQGIDAFGGTPSIPGTPSVATDFLKADVAVTFNQQTVPNPELTGTLDASAGIPGGTKIQVELTCMLKGSGTQGVAPQWGTLMQACGFTQTITSAAIGGPTAATAGTTGSATLAAPFGTNPEQYRGMPVVLSGNPTTPITVPILDYTAGRLAKLGYAFGIPLDTNTLAQIPPNVLYAPTSDPASIKSATIYIFMDGLLWRIPGCVGNWMTTMPTGQPGTIKFTLTGQYQQPTAVTTPTGIVFDAVQPPVFRNNLCRLNGQLARTSSVTFDCGNTLYEPENPEAYEGFDPSVITNRQSKGTFDPLMNTVDTIARVAAFRSGQAQSASVVLGVNPGNQVAIMAPTALYTGFNPTNRNDTMAETIQFEANGANASLFLSVF